MYQNPRPTHGFFPVIVASGVYALLALGAGVVAAWVGASGAVSVGVVVLAALALLPVFVPLFRRLTPRLGVDE
jgi:hypothetical protein